MHSIACRHALLEQFHETDIYFHAILRERGQGFILPSHRSVDLFSMCRPEGVGHPPEAM